MIRRHKRKVFAVVMVAVGALLAWLLGWQAVVGACVGVVVCEIRDRKVA